jgi:hypothetical protein
MDRPTKYFSPRMLKAQEARGKRQSQEGPHSTSGTYNVGYIDDLAAAMEECDPGGKRSRSLAIKYRK